MLEKYLYSLDKLDLIIKNKLKAELSKIEGYIFEGADYNLINFSRLLVFTVNRLYESADLKISPTDRWVNAYYWYSVYL